MITIDKGHDIPVYSEVCTFCKNFNRESRGRTCKAFPEEIPQEIWLGKHDHKTPFPGDHGIRFEKVGI